jgi:hypothetical protein
MDILEQIDVYLGEATRDKAFTDDQLDKLRSEYDKIKTIDPLSPAYKKVEKFMDGLDVDQLKGIAFAKIKWLSMLAANRLKFKHNIKLSAKDYMGKR